MLYRLRRKRPQNQNPELIPNLYSSLAYVPV
jgi:hypothetical protein